jgi:hypothetical protein
MTSEPSDSDSSNKPWLAYSRSRVWSGISYPVGQSDIEKALLLADASVGHLRMLVPQGIGEARPRRDDTTLLWVAWSGDDRVRGSHAPQQARSMLTVCAVRSTMRQTVRRQLLESGLPQAARWLHEAAHRGPAWTGMNHGLRLWLSEDGAHFAED